MYPFDYHVFADPTQNICVTENNDSALNRCWSRVSDVDLALIKTLGQRMKHQSCSVYLYYVTTLNTPVQVVLRNLVYYSSSGFCHVIHESFACYYLQYL